MHSYTRLIPRPVAFLGVGVAAGLLGLGPDLSAVRLEQVGAVLLFVILFQGGLATGLGAARSLARPIFTLGVAGTALTAAGVTLVARACGLDWPVAVLVGVALSPTDPAAVYSLLRGRAGSPRARTILEGESGFNDPAGIALMLAVTSAVAGSHASYAHAVVVFVEQMAIGGAFGMLGGLALRRLRLPGVALVVAAGLLGGAAAWLHGSGFLAVYLAGLFVSDVTHTALPSRLGAVAEPVLFALLGAAFASTVGGADLLRGILLTVATVLVVRPLVAAACLAGCTLTGRERLLVSWGGLKGAVPLLLAAYPALKGFEATTTVEAVVLVATAASLVLQGSVLALNVFE